MQGIRYLVDESGNRTAVDIDLSSLGDLWERSRARRPPAPSLRHTHATNVPLSPLSPGARPGHPVESGPILPAIRPTSR